MKGLLWKEFYTCIKNMKVLLGILALFCVMTAFTDNSFIPAYAITLASMIPFNLLAYDEKEHWDICADSLPYTRRQIVSSKYLSALLLELAVIVLLAAAQFIYQTRSHGQVSADGLLSLASVALLIPSLTLPLCFKYGAGKGRIVFLAIFVLLGASIYLIDEAAPTLPALAAFPGGLSFLFVLIWAALFGVSWMLSVIFYEKREF